MPTLPPSLIRLGSSAFSVGVIAILSGMDCMGMLTDSQPPNPVGAVEISEPPSSEPPSEAVDDDPTFEELKSQDEDWRDYPAMVRRCFNDASSTIRTADVYQAVRDRCLKEYENSGG